MPAPDAILELIERFERDRKAYRSAQYNEFQLRLEFLNPSTGRVMYFDYRSYPE